jgi:hypothetical protein
MNPSYSRTGAGEHAAAMKRNEEAGPTEWVISTQCQSPMINNRRRY